jgi:hypothetical protein
VCVRVEVTDTLDSTSPPDNQQDATTKITTRRQGRTTSSCKQMNDQRHKAHTSTETIMTKDIRRTTQTFNDILGYAQYEHRGKNP